MVAGAIVLLAKDLGRCSDCSQHSEFPLCLPFAWVRVLDCFKLLGFKVLRKRFKFSGISSKTPLQTETSVEHHLVQGLEADCLLIVQIGDSSQDFFLSLRSRPPYSRRTLALFYQV
ncbi:hypothetical protein NE237_013074 [Protea cynaroides]|uniref:Uncharacterized protein n=1 Tax=Protea cynaroides TaxID=273540 RepID=A0A9Q0H0A6_9MAGN|nr:hypothetical protein NE237_013074 [Protea cynaroides]